ncbi:MAG: RNA polymerase sigma factor [Bacteroidales bacterium]|nr:RNA polymerase sigma factor [Bacteroidales bacterium]MCF8350408.1 RNA polymerase sigma factor [Bacteroidales bacterium]MCF8377770.1 RNA polymerase sigma factor [Bacteroidales bacterium]
MKEFTELIKQHQGIIHKVSVAYCNGIICKEDLFQDILLQLWRSFETYDKARKFSTWMYRVALNTAISQLRKIRPQEKDISSEITAQIYDAEEQKDQQEKARILHAAINKLSKAEKSIIVLYMDDYPYEEISEIIGISVSNVGVKINRIKKKLQIILKELGYGL